MNDEQIVKAISQLATAVQCLTDMINKQCELISAITHPPYLYGLNEKFDPQQPGARMHPISFKQECPQCRDLQRIIDYLQNTMRGADNVNVKKSMPDLWEKGADGYLHINCDKEKIDG